MYISVENKMPLIGETVLVLFEDGIEKQCAYSAGEFMPLKNEIVSGAKPTHWKRLPGNARALNWKQPYATLMLNGKVETRSWNTEYRGLVLLCCSRQGYTKAELEKMAGKRITSRIELFSEISDVEVRPGHAFATARLVNCRPMTKEDEYMCFVKFKKGLFCHFYSDVTPIIPFGWPGYQGWKKLSLEQLELIQYLKTYKDS